MAFSHPPERGSLHVAILMTQADQMAAQPGQPMPQPDIDAFYRLAAARRDMRNGF